MAMLGTVAGHSNLFRVVNMKTLAMLTLVVVLQVGCSGNSEGDKSGDGKSESDGAPEFTREDALDLIRKRIGTAIHADEDPEKPIIGVELFFTETADDDLPILKVLPELKSLDLKGCSRITDAGLVHLEGMSKLETLNLEDTEVTDDGVNKLKAALPKCQIKQ